MDTGRQHDFPHSGTRLGGGLKVAGPMSFGDGERRPTMPVLPVPNLDLRALVGEELDHLWQVLERGGMHRGVPVGIDRVHIGPQFQEQLGGF
jgi:hypothetical protein